jgi:hypothetical protein
MTLYLLEQLLGVIISLSLTLSFVFYIRFKWNQMKSNNLSSLLNIIGRNTVPIFSILFIYSIYIQTFVNKLEKDYNYSIKNSILNKYPLAKSKKELQRDDFLMALNYTPKKNNQNQFLAFKENRKKVMWSLDK